MKTILSFLFIVSALVSQAQIIQGGGGSGGTVDTTQVATKNYVDPRFNDIQTKVLYKAQSATQGDATAGVDSAKYVTPKRVAQAIAALSPVASLQPETSVYAARMTAAGSVIDGATLFALDKFIVTGKRDGWAVKLKEFAPILGSNLAGALVKFVAGTGLPTSLSAVNFVAADYVPAKGFVLTTNTNKVIYTGFIPSAQGLSNTNFAFGGYVPDETAVNGGVLGDNPASGAYGLVISDKTIGFGTAGTAAGNAVGGRRIGIASSSGTGTIAYLNGAAALNTSTVSSLSLTSEVTLFKITNFGTPGFSTGSLGCYIILSSLTQSEALSLSQALLKLYQEVGRIPTVGGITIYFGDSNTAGQGATSQVTRWTTTVSRYLGTQEINLGVPASQLRQDLNAAAGGFPRYTNLLTIPANNVVIMYGTNDKNTGDVTTNGNATLVADFQTKLSTMIAAFKANRQRVIVCTPPWGGTAVSSIKSLSYVEATVAAANSNSVTVVDMWYPFLDTGSPGSYFAEAAPAELHFNDAGSTQIVSPHIVAAFQGRIYRDVPLDFPSITGGSYQDLTVTMYGAKAGQTVTVNLPQSLSAQDLEIKGWVSAPGVVTLRLKSATTYDPPAANYLTTVTLNN